MYAVIPAAGRGSRLGELTADGSKRLVDVTFLLLNGDNFFVGSVASAVAAVGEAGATLAVEDVSPEVAVTISVIEMDKRGRVNVNTPGDVERANEMVHGESRTNRNG
ncbi:hypothetical protein [Haloquadratum walsbyi]|jgi:hypothetical protein|uniref:Uncharacterized protein n=1 Tax=Haloquadratum walsbyi J07HQW2 TaxID=1238425 RepID=U1NEL2_9EURY|nr:hypothetical protein [Haloquadratum walsbyi]ERG95203.1 MAG: hypothetical protein J07HQW2_01652 [Haloquadratum walsbyi J07HQW2]